MMSDNVRADRRSPDQKFCYACGSVIHSTAVNCPECGATQVSAQASQLMPANGRLPYQDDDRSRIVAASQVFCRGCGRPLHNSAPLCPHCGAPQVPLTDQGRTIGQKNKVVAAVLA